MFALMKPQWKDRASAGSSDTAVKLQSPFLAVPPSFPSASLDSSFSLSSLSSLLLFGLLGEPELEVDYQRDGEIERQRRKQAGADNPCDGSTHSHTPNFAPAAEPRVALALLSAPSMDPIH